MSEQLMPIPKYRIGDTFTIEDGKGRHKRWEIVVGDSVEVLATLEENSIDAIVTDPPYGLKFMGKDWDNMGHGNEQQAWHYRWAVEALRVLKPGGHLLAFGGTRTYHRLASAIEDAGFEIRDQIQWLYGTGFPKSLNVSKAIDSYAKTGKSNSMSLRQVEQEHGGETYTLAGRNNGIMGEPAVWERKDYHPETAWEGWGTALKPAHEPIVVARKPLIGTVAKNVLEWGTGGLNIDATRIVGEKGVPASPRRAKQNSAYGDLSNDQADGTGWDKDAGRWPANVILDDEAGAMLDAQTGETGNKWKKNYGDQYADESKQYGGGSFGGGGYKGGTTYADRGGASRFFYCAKASKAEREAGLEDWNSSGGSAGDITVRGNTNPVCQTCKKSKIDRGNGECKCGNPKWVATNTQRRNTHPTVKPVALMRYLIRLVTPPGGVVLDPFVGSGSTGIAAVKEGFWFVGVDVDSAYCDIARARIGHAAIGEDS